MSNKDWEEYRKIDDARPKSAGKVAYFMSIGFVLLVLVIGIVLNLPK